MTDPAAPDLAIVEMAGELAEYWEAQCNRYVNGRCDSRACMVRGGWRAGPVDYSVATCEEHETAVVLRALAKVRGR